MLFDKFNRPLELIEILAGDSAETFCSAKSSEDPCAAFLFPTEHIVAFMKVMAALGLKKALLTGKEPLNRPDLVELVSGLTALRPKLEIIIRTASPLLEEYIQPLKLAGVGEVRVTLPTVDRFIFPQAAGAPEEGLERIMRGMKLGKELGIRMVAEIQKTPGGGRQEAADAAMWAISNGYPVRLLEPSENNDIDYIEWTIGVIGRAHRLEHGPGRYLWKAPASDCFLEYVTEESQRNCHDCRRLWLSADGKIKLCAHHHEEHDLGELFRDRACQTELLEFAAKIPLNKPQGFYRRNC